MRRAGWRVRRPPPIVRLLLLTLLLAAPAEGVTVDLLHGRALRIRDDAGGHRDSLSVQFAGETLVTPPLPSLLCPATSTISIRTDSRSFGPVSLDCRNWRAVRSGYAYADRTGSAAGVRKLSLSHTAKQSGSIRLQLSGATYAPAIGGPTSFVEVRLETGNTAYCGRFEPPTSVFPLNDAARVWSNGPSIPCALAPTPTPAPTATPTATPTGQPACGERPEPSPTAIAGERAVFEVTSVVAAASPPRFGLNLFAGSELNLLSVGPGMEPQVARLRGVVTAGGTTSFHDTVSPTTDYWDTIADGFFDGATVRIYRDDGSAVRLVRTDTVVAWGAVSREVILGGTGEPILAGDVYWVDLERSDPPLGSVATRLPWLRNSGPWRWFGDARHAHTGEPRPGSAGRSSMRIDVPTATTGGIAQYRYGYPDNGYYPVLEPGKTYRMVAWLRQEGIAEASARFRLSFPYHSVTRTFTGLTSQWQHVSHDFTVPVFLVEQNPVVQNVLEFNGPGTLFVDDLRVYDASQPPLALLPPAPAELAAFAPGVLRFWAGHENGAWGTTVDDWTRPDGNELQSWDPNDGPRTTGAFKLPTALPLAASVGASPWLIVGPFLSESEWLDLLDYLAGDAGTPYADRRIAQGRPAPWTDAFETIYLEFDNEPWNPMFTWHFGDPAAYGRTAEHFFGMARTSPHWARLEGKLRFVVGGWDLSPGLGGYGARAAAASPSATEIAIPGYIGGWETGIPTPSTPSDEGYQAYLLQPFLQHFPLVESHVAVREALRGTTRDLDLAVYEAGPGYDLPGSGIPPNAAQEAYGKSIAGAVATLDGFLYRSYRGFGPQAFFHFSPGSYWTTHTARERGFRAHPSTLALRLRNREARGDMLVTHRVDSPWLAVPVDGTGSEERRAPLVQTYAFREGDRYAIFLLSRSIDRATEVELRLPFCSASSVVEHALQGDLRSTNVDAQNVAVTTSDRGAFSGNAWTTTLAPGNLVLIVFEGTGAFADDGLAASVEQLPEQDDPTSLPLARFHVRFSAPLAVDLVAGQLVVGGPAGGSVSAVAEVPGSRRTQWLVDVSGFVESGVASLAVPAGAVSDIHGRTNHASTGIDNAVEYRIPPPADRLLVHSGFSPGDAGGVAPNAPWLQGFVDGTGWTEPWQAQNWTASSTAGYQLATDAPLAASGTAASPGHARGGWAYTTASRRVDVAGALSDFRIPGSQPARAGLGGTTLWFSALLRKDRDDGTEVSVGLVDDSYAWVKSSWRLFFGTRDRTAGKPYAWAIGVQDSNGTWDVASSSAPVQVGVPVLLVARVRFGATSEVELFVDPPTDGSPPSAPDAELSTTVPLAFRTIGFYAGRDTLDGSIDELCVGDTFDAVVRPHRAAPAG